LSDTTVLAVDTCFGACSAAVVRGAHVLGHRNQAMDRGHAEALAPMVEAVIAESGIGFESLDKLAVTTGPGTFTGQRVGLAFMRGLRVALQKPLVGVTSLAAMAERARRESGAAAAAAVHDAKRGEVYLEAVGRTLPARVLPFQEAVALLAEVPDLVVTGTGARRMADALGGARVIDDFAPDGIWVARLAFAIAADAVPRPLYLRAPDAKLPGR